jgi:hypothetical protein
VLCLATGHSGIDANILPCSFSWGKVLLFLNIPTMNLRRIILLLIMTITASTVFLRSLILPTCALTDYGPLPVQHHQQQRIRRISPICHVLSMGGKPILVLNNSTGADNDDDRNCSDSRVFTWSLIVPTWTLKDFSIIKSPGSNDSESGENHPWWIK